MLIRVAFYSIAELGDDLSASIDALPFGECEKARLRAIKNEGALRHSLAALTALSALCDRDELTIVRDGNGKPHFSAEGAPHFNLSHAGGLAVAALSYDAPIGVDLETARDARKESAVAHRFFTNTEQKEFSSHGDFSAIWTRKEARVKCLGVPLSSMLKEDLALSVRTYRKGEFTLSLAAERDFEVAFSQNDFPFQEVIL